MRWCVSVFTFVTAALNPKVIFGPFRTLKTIPGVVLEKPGANKNLEYSWIRGELQTFCSSGSRSCFI